MKRIAPLIAALVPIMTGGCVSTAASVAKAPFKVAGWTADKLTTSRDESDRNYGRRIREEEERLGREQRRADAQCRRERGADAPCGRYVEPGK